MTEENKKKLFKLMQEVRKQNPQFDNLVSQIDTELERYIENFKNTPMYLKYNHQPSFYGLRIKLVVPYVKITEDEHSYLILYLREKYEKFGDYFWVSKKFFKKEFKITNGWRS